MQYHAYEMAHAMITPMRIGAQVVQDLNSSVFNPMAHTMLGKSVAAACEVFEGVTRRYGKPEFGIDEIKIGGLPVPVTEQIVLRKPFGDLLSFERDESVCGKRYDPKVLLLAPLSGHYATLLRGTVRSMLPEHDLYISDWRDARNVPLIYGSFGFEDYVDYIIDFIRFLGPNTHVIAVCQPAVPALVAAAVMAASEDNAQPASLTLMGGPIDTRRNPTEVNKLAQSKSLDWFKRNVIARVPFPHPGMMREVYPGFIQLSGFMTMNMDRHVSAHSDLYQNLVKGDCDSVEQHRKFYEEYLSVMDLPAEFYLDTVKRVFQDHALPDRKLTHRGKKVDCSAIKQTALMTVEGERDDICGIGQTEAAHDLCTNVPDWQRVHYVQPGVGHYGVFNGTRWRTEIQPRIREMIRSTQFNRRIEAKPPAPVKRVAEPQSKIAETPKAPAKKAAVAKAKTKPTVVEKPKETAKKTVVARAKPTVAEKPKDPEKKVVAATAKVEPAAIKPVATAALTDAFAESPSPTEKPAAKAKPAPAVAKKTTGPKTASVPKVPAAAKKAPAVKKPAVAKTAAPKTKAVPAAAKKAATAKKAPPATTAKKPVVRKAAATKPAASATADAKETAVPAKKTAPAANKVVVTKKPVPKPTRAPAAAKPGNGKARINGA